MFLNLINHDYFMEFSNVENAKGMPVEARKFTTTKIRTDCTNQTMPAPDFGSREYWDKRYLEEGNKASYEWYFPFKTVQRGIEANTTASKSERILILGNGTSDFGIDMFHAGYRSITCIDFSSAAVRIMSQRQDAATLTSLECMTLICAL